MNYPAWNQKIFERVFNPEREGKTTSVYIDEEILQSWAVESGYKGITAEEAAHLFVKACLAELRHDASQIAKYCSESALVWKRKEFEGAPPYIGMLGLLVLSATWGEGSGHLFYGRYWKLTNSSKEGMIPNMEDVRICWKQLQKYSEIKQFSLGIYKVRTLAPAKVNVGVIVAQGVLRPSDSDTLKDIFFDEGADSNIDYSDQHIKSWLEKHRSKLSSRAQKALESDDNSDYLVSRVREELTDWDGEPADWASRAGKTRTFRRRAFLCFNRGNDGQPYGTIRLDFSGRSGDPENVKFGDYEQEYVAYDNGDAVSTPLENAPDANLDERKSATKLKLLSPQDFQKFKSGDFRSTLSGNSYKYQLGEGSARVFVDGAAMGLDGYIETDGLKPGFGHIIILRLNDVTEEVKVWCKAHSDSSVNIKDIVPEYFTGHPLLETFAIHANSKPCPVEKYSALQYEIKPLARLVGGLKLYRTGNIYLKSLPPDIAVSSRHQIACSINDGESFVVERQKICLSDMQLAGSIRIELREDIEDGRQSELNLQLHDGAEWAKDREGEVHNLTAPLVGAANLHVAYLGTRIGAYTTESSECEHYKASWVQMKDGSVIPCASLATISTRVRHMDGSTRVGAQNPQRDAKWRESIAKSILHKTFKMPALVDLWNSIKQRTR